MSEPDPLVLDLSDEELVALLRRGEVDRAMTTFESRYGDRIVRFAEGMCRDAHLAQDIAQEVFKKLLLRHDLYRPGTNFRAWLFEIARNQTFSAMRSRQRLPRPISTLQGSEPAEGDPLAMLAAPAEDRDLELDEFMTAFHAAVAGLPPHYREVFELCVRKGMPYQEAGNLLGVPTGTVAIRIMRARRRLYGELQRHIGRLRRPPACFQ